MKIREEKPDATLTRYFVLEDGTLGIVRFRNSPSHDWTKMGNDEYKWLRQLAQQGYPENRLPMLPAMPED